MTLSTILNPSILEYVRISLNIRGFIHLYKRLMDCLNIMQMVVKINDLKNFDKLAFLV